MRDLYFMKFAKITGREYMYVSSNLLVQPVKIPTLRAPK